MIGPGEATPAQVAAELEQLYGPTPAHPVLPPVPPPSAVGRAVMLTLVRGGATPYRAAAEELMRSMLVGLVLGAALLVGMAVGREATLAELR